MHSSGSHHTIGVEIVIYNSQYFIKGKHVLMHATITAMAKSKKKSNDPLGVTEQANELCFTQS